ncbi:acyltransferase family protein [Achromobacter xylosoxidans]|uniref:acyltransferase family protein n=1 Tax=Alcaligenes xylosoxydans xylosoxydans TaxID=85698 RepID=UPI0029549B17|nr:acyltransferase [Achromobacter xylosoxidans]
MKYLKELEGVRGIMALWVVIAHVLGALPAIPGPVPNGIYSVYPVYVFIILSGFVIFSMLDREKVPYGRYLLARALRIFPVYWLVLALSVLSLTFAADVLRASPIGFSTEGRLFIIDVAKSNLAAHVLLHIPLLQGLPPTVILPYSALTIVGQAWSLTLEWQFYIVAPLLFWMARSINKKKAQLTVLAVSSVCWLLTPYMDGGFIGSYLPMFMVGFLSYFFYRNVVPRLSKEWLGGIAAVSFAGSLIFLKEYAVPVAIWVALLYFICADSRTENGNEVARLLRGRALTYLGKISYPLFLGHMQVLFGCMWLANKVGLQGVPRIVLLPVLTIGAAILFADCVHRVVERPFHEMGRGLAKRAPAKAPRADGLA